MTVLVGKVEMGQGVVASLPAIAAEELSVSMKSVDRVMLKADRSKRVSYAELAAGNRIERKLEGRAAAEKIAAYSIVGKPLQRRDATDKVTDRAKYACDIAPPGGCNALHARILRPLAHGVVMTRVDTSEAEMHPGVRVIRAGGRGGQQCYTIPQR